MLVAVVTATPFGNMLYMGNRIKGNISVTVNGRNIDLSQCQFTFSYNGKIEQKADCTKIYIEGGRYGAYDFSFQLKEPDIPVKNKNISVKLASAN